MPPHSAAHLLLENLGPYRSPLIFQQAYGKAWAMLSLLWLWKLRFEEVDLKAYIISQEATPLASRKAVSYPTALPGMTEASQVAGITSASQGSRLHTAYERKQSWIVRPGH